MKKQNKIDPEFHIEESVEIIGDMQYYIDYCFKLFYPDLIKVSYSDEDDKYIQVFSKALLGKDEYRYFVEFNPVGEFKKAYSYFAFKGISDTCDQNEFKRILKKEIQKVNNLHGVTAKLLNR